jgi:hypothetical protein
MKETNRYPIIATIVFIIACGVAVFYDTPAENRIIPKISLNFDKTFQLPGNDDVGVRVTNAPKADPNQFYGDTLRNFILPGQVETTTDPSTKVKQIILQNPKNPIMACQNTLNRSNTLKNTLLSEHGSRSYEFCSCFVLLHTKKSPEETTKSCR